MSDGNIFTRFFRCLRQKQTTGNQRIFFEVLNASPNCCAVVAEGNFRFVNQIFTELLGFQEGDSVQACFSEENWNLWTESIKKGIPVEKHPISIKTVNQKHKELLVSVKPLNEYAYNGYLLYCTDITVWREKEEALNEAKAAAEVSVKQKSEFLANMSHEIRTPMNAVLGMIYLALRTELTPKQKEYLEGAEQSAKLLLRIINDILDFSKIEAGRLVMEYREFPLQHIIDDILNLIAESVRKKNIDLTVEGLRDVPESIMGDSVRLRQILINLLSNAVKFVGDGGKIVLRVETVEQDGLSVLLRFSVQDDGIGMTAEQIKRLFAPFSQAEASTTRRFGGTGLGLAISKRIVEMMKGSIECQSVVQQGTTFTFTARFGLPLEGDLSDVPTEAKTTALILCDNLESVQSTKNCLELFSCTVTGVCSSHSELESFLQSAEAEEVDFVLFDFDNLTAVGERTYALLSGHYGDSLPQLIFSTDIDKKTLKEVLQITVPFLWIRHPIDLTELFNALMQITSEKKLHTARQLKRAAAGEQASQTAPRFLRGTLILLAEDNRINQIVASEILQQAGCSVDIADNGRIAVEMVGKKDYDLVLMDIWMPEMDGLEATAEIRNRLQKRDLPIVALSADAMSGDAERSLAAGMNAHTTKPIDPAELFETIANLLRNKRTGY